MDAPVTAVVAVARIVRIGSMRCVIANLVSVARRLFIVRISSQRHPVTEDRDDKPCD
ncbi:MAG: hypothetical protein HPY30_01365 [Gammaproteobacteria bacterium (ex Lamellibrachia satsuma)]|nr:MAG: hypothetical protein HPY30_01365 [Gammaproteobacteria bacterium (ex Lamellibrachia satsuma)]